VGDNGLAAAGERLAEILVADQGRADVRDERREALPLGEAFFHYEIGIVVSCLLHWLPYKHK
jgi:hypothetical protein